MVSLLQQLGLLHTIGCNHIISLVRFRDPPRRENRACKVLALKVYATSCLFTAPFSNYTKEAKSRHMPQYFARYYQGGITGSAFSIKSLLSVSLYI